jgi:hypothetical protein
MSIDYFESLVNPFLIDIEDKEQYTYQDYLDIQKKLSEKNLDKFLDDLYPNKPIKIPKDVIEKRCKRGITQKMINLSDETVPKIKVHKIGSGGDGKSCFVCFTTLFDIRCDLSGDIVKSLENVGYNGHFLLLNGGFPNPTGKEMKYIGVPYSFKIFMMLEAKKLGFEKVIWIDSACYASNNVDYLFDYLSHNDALFAFFNPNHFEPDSVMNNSYAKTVGLLSSLVGRDIRNDMTINSIVFGLNFNSKNILDFVNEYYEMVKIGLPFLTYFPEEMVFTAILNKPKYSYIFNHAHRMVGSMLYVHEAHVDKTRNRSFFLQRHH